MCDDLLPVSNTIDWDAHGGKMKKEGKSGKTMEGEKEGITAVVSRRRTKSKSAGWGSIATTNGRSSDIAAQSGTRSRRFNSVNRGGPSVLERLLNKVSGWV